MEPCHCGSVKGDGTFNRWNSVGGPEVTGEGSSCVTSWWFLKGIVLERGSSPQQGGCNKA